MDWRYYGLCLAVPLAQHLPTSLGYFLADRGGDVFYLSSTRRRGSVMHNIRRAVQADASPGTTQPKARIVFENASKNYFDLTRLPQIDFDHLERQFTIVGMPHYVAAQDAGKGVIIATAHLGNYEYCSHILAAQGIEMLILVENFVKNPFLRKLVELRRKSGIRILPVNISGIKEALQTLRRGGTVLIVFDRDLQGNGLKVKFFGVETPFPVGVVDLALRTGAAIVPKFGLRGPRNRTSIYIESPLKIASYENRDQALRTTLESLVAILERYIRHYPEQWVVLEPA
jgi:lauroyl/myristoyl acyltransferase